MGKPHLTAEQRAMALRLRAKGLNFTEIGEQIDSDGLDIEIVGFDGSPLRRLVLDPTKDYQRIA